MSLTLQEYRAKLSAAARSQLDAEVQRVLEDARGPGEDAARRYAPARSGKLRASIGSRVSSQAGEQSLELDAGGGQLPYAAVQAAKGSTTIRAGGHRMAVPVGGEVASRYAGMSSLRQAPELFSIRDRKGRVWLCSRNSGTAQLRFWFRLVAKVTIQGQGFLERALEDLQATVPDQLQAAVVKALEARR